GSMSTASLVFSHATTKPFCMNGPAVSTWTIMVNQSSVGSCRSMGSCSLQLQLRTDQATMIIAVLDDLMFTSKIRTTAGQLGVAVTFARSAYAALGEMRKQTPSLVILDLNNPRINPLGIVSSMKQDPALASIPTVGYASHVQTDVIDAARRAGVDDVMAR